MIRILDPIRDTTTRTEVNDGANLATTLSPIARCGYFGGAGAGTIVAGRGQLPSYGGQFGTARSAGG
jgi:hypothetical protein